MKFLLTVILFTATTTQIVAPPLKQQKNEEMKTDPFDAFNVLEYKSYIQEVLKELGKDKEFQSRLENISGDGNITSMADQLRFASNSVRTRLDEIKRREIARLNELEKEYRDLKEKKDSKAHVVHDNPHTFETDDLERLIRKVSNDLVEVDEKQEAEYKEYEMAKELKKRKKLQGIKDKKQRHEEELKYEESKKRHRKHDKVHHPGSEEHLKEVWEKEDHMDKDTFDYKTFFSMHDKDGNGHLDEGEIEALMMGELDKVYDENNPDDDMMERYHEMMKMRQEMMREADFNGDKVISMDEFRSWTKKKEYKKDPEWKTTEEIDQPAYTKDELREFNKKNKIHPDEYLEDFDGFEDGTLEQTANQAKAMHMEQHNEKTDEQHASKTPNQHTDQEGSQAAEQKETKTK